MAAAAPDRTILVIKKNGDKLRVTVPATAKVTFAGINPQQPGYSGNALRIYTTANNQLAVFTGVSEFRDLALPVEVQQRTTKKSSKAVSFGEDELLVASDYETNAEWKAV